MDLPVQSVRSWTVFSTSSRAGQILIVLIVLKWQLALVVFLGSPVKGPGSNRFDQG